MTEVLLAYALVIFVALVCFYVWALVRVFKLSRKRKHEWLSEQYPGDMYQEGYDD